jgi:predicted PurR-regulated permease PerM
MTIAPSLRVNTFYRPIQQSFLILVLIAVFGVVAYALISTQWIVLSALLGIGLGVLLIPGMAFLRKNLKIPRPVTAAIFFFLVVGSMSGLGYLLFVVASRELIPLVDDAPRLLSQAQKTLLGWADEVPALKNALSKVNVGEHFARIPSALFLGLGAGANAVAGVFFVLFIALYMAVSPNTYRDGFLSLFPAHLRSRINGDMSACAKNLRIWFYAQVVAAAIVGILMSIGLLAIGVDIWVAGGLLAFALDFIPYIGPFIAAGMIGLLTLGSEPDKLLPALGIFVLMQQIESNLVIPIVMKGRADLPPIHLITLMLMFGTWFGFLGVLMAPPLLMVVRTWVAREYLPWMDAREKPAAAENAQSPSKLIKRSV